MRAHARARALNRQSVKRERREAKHTCIHVPTCVGACGCFQTAHVSLRFPCVSRPVDALIKPQRPVNSAMCTGERGEEAEQEGDGGGGGGERGNFNRGS